MLTFGTNNLVNSKKTMFSMSCKIDENKLLYSYNTQKQA